MNPTARPTLADRHYNLCIVRNFHDMPVSVCHLRWDDSATIASMPITPS